ncbi:hypothetical protein DFJ74DRAFT_703578 [Hyaloraphidium curvatum]|nr:hypothetical protein DFJ74DRAFT_703578 [Hyaloraphidium curvatum]
MDGVADDADAAGGQYKYMKPPAERQRGPVAWIRRAYYKYELATALYMLDPWEKTIFNTIVVFCLVFSAYTAYRYTPDHIRETIDFTSWLFAPEASKE